MARTDMNISSLQKDIIKGKIDRTHNSKLALYLTFPSKVCNFLSSNSAIGELLQKSKISLEDKESLCSTVISCANAW